MRVAISIPVLNSEGKVVSYKQGYEDKGPLVRNTFDGLSLGIKPVTGTPDGWFMNGGSLHPGKPGKERR